ncbi:MAG: ABC transporter permease subunit [Eubacteriales bacterium]|nr:ABC transporter permease subunit [Eubacteriales bacterium]
MLALLKKEFTEQLRSGRILILILLFVFLGIMNPAIAKLTPWVFEMLSDSLAENGMTFTNITVDAATSWTQFFKNIPVGLIVFVLLQSSIFTKEYQNNTLVMTLTKGLSRYKIVIAKTFLLSILWSVCYWITFAITYGYNEYYWDNSILYNLVLSGICLWLLGLWVVILTVFWGTLAKSNTSVLVGTGSVFLISYLVGLLPNLQKYTPAMLIRTATLHTGNDSISLYYTAMVVTAILCIILIAVSIPIFNKKSL